MGKVSPEVSAQVRNNIMVALSDLTVRYTALVDAHVPRLAACLGDPHELVRRQALALLASLLSRVRARSPGSKPVLNDCNATYPAARAAVEQTRTPRAHFTLCRPGPVIAQQGALCAQGGGFCKNACAPAAFVRRCRHACA